MKIDVQATMNAAGDSDWNRPIDHDVCLQRLPAQAAELARNAIHTGIPYYHSRNLLTWVPYPELATEVGFGFELHDPTCPYHVPPAAITKPVFLPELITDSVAAACVTSRAALDRAREKARFLAGLRDRFPPRPYDLHVDWSPDDELPLLRMIYAGRLDAFPGDRCWWVIRAEAAKLLPPHERFDDPEDWVDHSAVERFIAEHRRHWPEIYEYQHPECEARELEQSGFPVQLAFA